MRQAKVVQLEPLFMSVNDAAVYINVSHHRMYRLVDGP